MHAFSTARFLPGLWLCAAAAAQGEPVPDSAVALPPRWYSGDTHVHSQPCGGGASLDVAGLVQTQIAEGIHVACAAYWNPQKTLAGQLEYFNLLEPLIDGLRHPASQPAAPALLQFGVEVSGFNSSQFGHVCGIGIRDGAFPNLSYPGADLEYFLGQPTAIAGYSHVRWPLGYQSMNDMQLAHLVPAMLPVDAALGAVTFIEAPSWDPFDALDWRGAYYKLLNAGVRVALTAGSDNSCIYPSIGPVRTYVGTTGTTLDFDRWIDGVRAGRTSITRDRSVFLDMTAGSVALGDWMHLDAGLPLRPRIQVLTPPGDSTSGTLELLYNGAVVASTALSLPDGGEFVWKPNYLPLESGWFAASLKGVAHTAAIYLSVAGQPIASTLDAAYLREICDRLIVPPPPFVVPDSAAAIAARCTAARDMYDALAAIETPLVGVTRYGLSSAACDGPIVIGLDAAPLAGATVGVTCLHAPTHSVGALLIGTDVDLASIDVLGAAVYIDLAAPFFADPSQPNDGGYARIEYPIMPELLGQTIHMQYLWLNPLACAGSGSLSASDALRVQIQ
jgi:hypothetical protein